MTVTKTTVQLPTDPGSVIATDKEKASGKWSPKSLQRALELLHRDGVCILENVTNIEHIKALNEEMLPLSEKLAVKKLGLEQFNQGVRSNFLQAPPLHKPELLFEDVYQNDLIISIAECYLGPQPALSYITSNVALSKTTGLRQRTHKDTHYIHTMCPSLLTVQFMITPFSPENGSTEFYLGSHATTDIDEQVWETKDALRPMGFVKEAIVEERRKIRPPCQIKAPMGAVVLRDLRTWHAGMPNSTDENRIMLGVNYQSSWHPQDYLTRLPASSRPFFESKLPRVSVTAEYFPDEEWVAKCQETGKGQWGALRYGPEMEKGEWETVQIVTESEKRVLHTEG